MLDEVSDRGEQHGDEGDDGQQQIERQRAREEGNVVFERRLKGPPGNAGHRLMPAALGLHATGSSSSSSDIALLPPRRRRFASVSRRSIATRAVGASSSSSAVSSSSPSSPAFSAAMSPRTSAGRSHMRRLNGPIAFLRLL